MISNAVPSVDLLPDGRLGVEGSDAFTPPTLPTDVTIKRLHCQHPNASTKSFSNEIITYFSLTKSSYLKSLFDHRGRCSEWDARRSSSWVEGLVSDGGTDVGYSCRGCFAYCVGA